MKKIFYFLFIFLFFNHISTAFAQISLTNAQIYDFEIGDIIQGRHTYKNIYPGLSNPSSFETQTILGKRFSIKKDSIFYTIKRDYFTPKSCDTCFPSYISDTITQWFSQLTNLAEHYNESSQPFTPLIDSFSAFNGNSKRHIWAKIPAQCDSCKSPKLTYHKTVFIEGLGGPYFEKSSQNGQTFSEYTLVYYKKGLESYGNFTASSGIIFHKNQSINIYPNPILDNAKIDIPCLNHDGLISIYSADGKLCQQFKFIPGGTNEIYTKNLPNGLYQIVVESDLVRIGTRFVVSN